MRPVIGQVRLVLSCRERNMQLQPEKLRSTGAEPKRHNHGNPEINALPRPAEVEWSCSSFDATLAEFADASLDQSFAFSGARWGKRDEPVLLLYEGNEVAALARAVTVRLPAIGGGLAYVKFGPVWRRRGREPDPDLYRRAVEALTEECCGRRRMLLSIQPRPDPDFQKTEAAILAGLGFVERALAADLDRYMVNLTGAPEARLRQLGSAWRRNLKKSLAASLTCAVEAGEKSVVAFQALHTEMVTRKNAAHGDRIDALSKLAETLPPAVRPLIFIVRENGVPVAGAVVDVAGDPAQYLFGASSSRGLAVRAGFALHWHVAGELSRAGFRRYDLGGSVGEDGLARFKSGLVGAGGETFKMVGPFDFCLHAADRLRGELVHRLRERRAKIALSHE
jgi:hypothetical protein